jgi:hypothetical protein
MPLIKEIYGDDSKDIARFEDFLTLLKDKDVKKALARLKLSLRAVRPGGSG